MYFKVEPMGFAVGWDIGSGSNQGWLQVWA